MITFTWREMLTLVLLIACATACSPVFATSNQTFIDTSCSANIPTGRNYFTGPGVQKLGIVREKRL